MDGSTLFPYSGPWGTDGPLLWQLQQCNKGQAEKEEESGLDCYIILDDGYSKKSNKSWARLIKKIYEVDRLTCYHLECLQLLILLMTGAVMII